MFKHALIGIDFSPAWPCVRRRVEALRDSGLERVTLVYVLSSRYPSVPEESHRAWYEQRLTEEAGQLASPGLDVDWQIRTGEPGAELVAAADDIGADLLLMGSRGQSRFHEFFLGSTALDTARLAGMPLWLEPVGEECLATDQTILLATDGSTAAKSAEAVFADLAGRAQRALAVTVLDDAGSESSAVAEAKSHLAELSEGIASLETRIAEGDPRRVLTEMADAEDVDLLVLGKRGRNPLQQLLLGSVAEAACRGLDVPVLLVPDQSM
ncbi:universal stress protein [Spiribacter vilamensis]|uniref:Nucleotide-binding universal stress UspA family protein n=1 Tax=Spiribacter vilamensis TaxID=531306 RepID=A0A4Q8CZS8_9GAMM|nr:universal stress protein [Spiribacter vilamensis]RZU98539.1 nucleotide-binding universal stress UspA family protein [Spiribacter vilamensis]TVO60202.1 universal stress protein [Spiribacter vilamensis]